MDSFWEIKLKSSEKLTDDDDGRWRRTADNSALVKLRCHSAGGAKNIGLDTKIMIIEPFIMTCGLKTYFAAAIFNFQFLYGNRWTDIVVPAIFKISIPTKSPWAKSHAFFTKCTGQLQIVIKPLHYMFLYEIPNIAIKFKHIVRKVMQAIWLQYLISIWIKREVTVCIGPIDFDRINKNSQTFLFPPEIIVM